MVKVDRVDSEVVVEGNGDGESTSSGVSRMSKKDALRELVLEIVREELRRQKRVEARR